MFGFSNNQKGEASLFEKYSIDFNHKYGEGGYGATYACKEKASGEDRAVKIVDTRRMKKESVQKDLVAEIGDRQDEINVCDLAVDCTKVCLG